ncbi:MAG: response regulator transcription factor [Alistipes indistinctus]
MKIVVVDDHAAVPQRTSDALDGIEGFSVIGEASNGVELLELLPGIEPDVILLDIEMPKNERYC